jgi:hypothetical protein
MRRRPRRLRTNNEESPTGRPLNGERAAISLLVAWLGILGHTIRGGSGTVKPEPAVFTRS